MKKLSSIFLVLALCFTSCKNKTKDEATISPEISEVKIETTKEIKVTLTPKSESKVKGEVRFIETNGIVSMTANLSGLDPGEHAIHIHESSDCSSPDGKSTGGHWNPTKQPHGKWGAETGYHKGDIGNFIADANGNGSITLETNQWCIGCNDDAKNILGKAIIVHAGLDDFTTQPTGDAGGRISCGGIIE